MYQHLYLLLVHKTSDNLFVLVGEWYNEFDKRRHFSSFTVFFIFFIQNRIMG